ncbi:DNA-directed RNA polymerase V subunit 5A [Amaranthus tricolor]|uniref:DNA-directed RNA polymerase V subunit 5A n=1 Tax=Amaranthus tricolor TaxID=29722 RepID=UPI0025846B65|nr:DNA-directed RNA polymerase V subunit 5A [Amaranthus tricolor]
MEVDGEINGEAAGRCLASFIDDGTVESHRYYLARKTTLQMLKDRGYLVPNSELELTLQDFRNIYGPKPDPDRLRISTALVLDEAKKVLVIFVGPQLVKVNTIRGIAAQIVNRESLSGLILILQSRITNQAQKALDDLRFKVEIFQITDLLVNITRHVLKPKHQVLTPKEKEKLLKKYNLEDKQLPRMSVKDAIARYYGLERGQVLKVVYSGEITQSHVTYRCVW